VVVSPDHIEQVEPLDDELVESWQRLTDEPLLRGVEAHLYDDGSWQVGLWVAEFVREEPAESELRGRMLDALRAVPGAIRVYEEDREVWVVEGTPPGRALVAAAAEVVDSLGQAIRRQYPEMTWTDA